jgi:GNAT superfamily N-acetyltransferase
MDDLALKMSEYTIRDYVESDLPALMTHWKESVRGWPPGFNPVAEWTLENVSDWLLRKRFIATWLGVLDDKIVAYLRYTKYWGDPEVEMVDIFNAHPDFHGKSYGRKLLVHAVDRAVADKAKRLDLYTWAGNRKAVPLYKKCGFFWRPNISWTHMYNFLPVVLNNPLVKEFLGGSHWYDTMRQPLEVK